MDNSSLDVDDLKQIGFFLKQNMKFSPSHDMNHLLLVRNYARKIAKGEIESGKKIDLKLVEISAFFHDILDQKFVKQEEAKELEQSTKDFLKKVLQLNDVEISKVLFIMDNVSFSKEIKAKVPVDYSSEPELCCVQDADRLSAMGCLGVARAFCYGGERKQDMYYNKEMLGGTKQNPNTLDHFYDKLFLLNQMLKTETGKKMGEPLHQDMLSFVKKLLKQIKD